MDRCRGPLFSVQTPRVNGFAEASVDGAESSLEIKRVDHLSVLSDLWDELEFSAILRSSIPVDEQVKLRPEIGIKGLVLNLVSGRSPLYRVQDFYEGVATSALLGDEVTSTHFNDTALARLLDNFFYAEPEKIFSALSMKAIEHEDLEIDRVHADTTSKLLFGKYVAEDPDAISIAFGHSKDKRPDLKQVMFGVATDKTGVPVVGQMLDGNQSDKPWHGGMLEMVKERLCITEGQPFEYVGDSALITERNLAIASEKGIVLTGRLPRTVTACSDAMAVANGQPECWEAIGAISPQKGAARYQAQWFCSRVLNQNVTLGVYRSDHPNERAKASVMRRHAKQTKEILAKKKVLETTAFACERDANTATSAFIKELETTHLLHEWTVERFEERGSFPRRGRPAKGVERPVRIVYRVNVDLRDDEDALRRAIIDKSCFVLLHTGTNISSARELLQHYKDQSVTEKRFPFLKDATMCDVFFAKFPRRVEALGWIMLLAMLLWTLWERRVRINHKASGESPIRDTPGNEVKNPTAFVCRHILHRILLVRTASPNGSKSPWRYAAPLGLQQKRVIRFSKACGSGAPVIPDKKITITLEQGGK